MIESRRRASSAKNSAGAVQHPGPYVRETKLKPVKMSVTEAAKLIGISRPGVSNFLNGRVSATPEMATRIERAFAIPAQTLLDLQAAYDAAQAKEKGAPANAKAYVPPFLAIKANDIEGWVTHNIPARSRLSVFLRTLVHSTGIGLTKVDFPGNDDAELPGWDGFVEASEGTPWIPEGLSGWEFGTNENIKGKADKDFAKSVKAIAKGERDQTTFVFVTPRRWLGKKEWVSAAKANNAWKDVRAYDAVDLEQWLEQSVAGQAWFANETHIPAEDVRSLDRCWSDWAEVANPPLSGALFDSAIEAAKRTMLSRLSKDPDGPIVITADSTQEALALVAQLLSYRGGDELAAFRDRVVVFDKPGVLPRLAQGAQTFIPVAFTREVERELGPFAQSMHSIVIYPRNVANTEPHIVLEPLQYEPFRKALEEMGKDRDEVSRLANASGRSLTVLRRQLADVPAVRTPDWAAERKTASCLIPFLFVGAWDARNAADKEGLSLLAGRSYDELEKDIQALLQLDDAPVWSIGTFRGVISKIDLLYAIAATMTAAELKLYFSMARLVLGEDDPALDLAEDQRWAASLHGKMREFSAAFRDGISETLVLLAVHGNHLFKKRLGIDTEIEATLVVRDLLPTPLTERILEANDHDLPTYAEAAPDEFLSIFQRDLKSDYPVVLGLLKPADTGVFGRSPSRTGLLWALEGLSWSPVTLPRAAEILARLAKVEITDNWVNKPIHSLESVFRAWMPQTAASHENRVDVMKRLAEKFPDVAWKICVAQFGNHHQIGDYSHKPRWRPDGYGFGEPFPTWGPIISFMREMVEMALSWKNGHSVGMLCDLVERLQDLDEGYQARVWGLIEAWARDTASDADKATLREKIRVSTLSHRAQRRSKKDAAAVSLKAAAKQAYDALEPSDILNKHAWLFRDGWVDESADEIHGDEGIDLRKREERVTKLRIEALKEVSNQQGLEGVLELARRGKAAWQVGWLAATAILSETELKQLLGLALRPILAGEDGVYAEKNLVAGAFQSAADDTKRETMLKGVVEKLPEEDAARVALLAPFRKGTWTFIDTLNDAAQNTYWSSVNPNWIPDVDNENNEAVERLLKVDRPRAAFSCVRLQPERVDPNVMFRLLSEMATSNNEQQGQYQLENYSIQQAFKHIDAASSLTLEQKASLEFAYIEVLDRPWGNQEHYGIPNLERHIEQHPEVFVQAVAWTYKRKDGAKDPPEFQVSVENSKNLAHRGYKLLDALSRMPGHNPRGEFETDRLAKWVATVRQSCAELSRGAVGDICLGRLLSNCPTGADGVWPDEHVRQVMEDVQSEDMMSGAHTGVYNSRGAHWRGEGGDLERGLAEKYRKWGEALQFSHPFVSSYLLMILAKTYDHEASREDTEAGIRRRLR